MRDANIFSLSSFLNIPNILANKYNVTKDTVYISKVKL